MVGGIRINDSDLSNLLTMNQIRMVSSQLISNTIAFAILIKINIDMHGRAPFYLIAEFI